MNAEMKLREQEKAEEAARTAHADAKLANFGANGGRHGPMAAVQVRITVRVPRETALRLGNLARAVGLKPGALHVLSLETISRIPAGDFFAEVGRIQKAG
jgi:hypothetical protein